MSSWKWLPVPGGSAGNSPPVITQSRGTCRGCSAAAGKGPRPECVPMGPGQLSRALGAAHTLGPGQLSRALGAGGAAEPDSPRREAGKTPRQLDRAWRRKASPTPLLVTPALPLGLRSRAVSFLPLTSAGMLGPAHGDPGRTTASLGLTSSRCPDLCPCDSSRQSPTPCHPRPAAGGLRFRDAHKEKNMFSIRATLNIHK